MSRPIASPGFEIEGQASTPQTPTPSPGFELENSSAEAPLRQSILSAADKDPERQAKVLALSQRAKLPPSFVDRNFDEVQKRTDAADTDYSKLLRDTPHLANFLSDPNNAAVAKDDHPQLGAIEKLLDYGKSLVSGAVRGTGESLSGMGTLNETVGRSIARAFHIPDASIPWWLNPTQILRAPGQAVQSAGQSPILAVPPERQGFGTELAGSLGQFIPLIATSIVAGPEAVAAEFAGQGAEGMRQRSEQLGKYGTPASDIAIVSGAGINALAGQFGIEKLLERVPPAIKNVFLQRLADVTLSGGYQAGLQVAMDLANNVASKLTINPDQKLTGDLTQQALIGGATGAIARGILGVALPSLGEHLRNVEQAKQGGALFEELGKTVHDSKTFQRLPQKLQELVLRMTKDGPIENTYLPVEDIQTYAQSLNQDPGDLMESITPGGREKFNQAVSTSADVEVPIADYATKIAATEHAKVFNEAVRLGDPEAMNVREARQFSEEQKANVEPARPLNESQLDQSAGKVREDITGQMTSMGFMPSAVDAYARLYESAFRTIGERAGADPFSVYEPYRLRITRPLPEVLAKLPDTDTRIDTLIDQLRAGKRPDQGEMFGKSLLDFVREKGGVKDEGGDLASREVDADRKPFQKRIVNNETGVPLDTLREAAAEAGYLPTQSSMTDFLDAIDKEVRGEPVYAQGSENPQAIEQSIVLEQLDSYLKSKDIDIAKASNAEIKAALKEAATETGAADIDARTGMVLEQASSQPPSDPRVHLTGTEVGSFDQKTMDQVLRDGSDYYKRELQPLEPIEREGFRPFAFTAKGIGKILNASDRTKVQLIAAIPEILRNGEYLESRPDYQSREHIKAHHYFLDSVAVGDKKVWVRVTVREYTDGNVVYDLYYSPNEEQARRIPSRNAGAAEPGKGGGDTTLGQSIGPDTGDGNQTLNLDKRGDIVFGKDRRFSIRLLEGADLSTFLHESGHFYLEVFGDVVDELRTRPSELNESQQRMVADYDKMLGKLGVENREGIGVEQHEQFARSFEAYLREGKAPSPELRSIFQRFKGWLVNIYRSLQQLNVKLDPEVTGIFDRLLASDSEIEQATDDAKIRAMIEDQGQAERLGLNPDEFRAYAETVRKARDGAKDQLDSEYMDEYSEQQSDWYAARRGEVRSEVAAEVHANKDYVALSVLQDGTMPDGSPLPEGVVEPGQTLKLDAKALEERYEKYKDSSVMQALRKLDLYRREGGVDPDQAAELLGYSSGDEMIQSILKKQPMDEFIDAETTDRMRQSYGDMLTDGTAAEKARDAVMTEGRSKVIEAEMKALAKKVRETAPYRALGKASERQQVKGQRAAGMRDLQRFVPSVALARDIANDRIGDMRVRDVKAGLYYAAARREGNAAIEAVNRGDFQEALKHKQQELVSVEMYKAATETAKAVEKTRDYMLSFDKLPKRQRIGKAGGEANTAGSYLDQIDKLRERFEFSRQTDKGLDKRAKLKDFIAAQAAEGHELAIPIELQEEATKQNYRDMTVHELRGLKDAVQTIEHWANFKNKLLRNVAKRELDALGAEGAESIGGNRNGKPRQVPLEPDLPGYGAQRKTRSWELAHRPLQAILRQMDGYKDGFFFDNVYRPAAEARDAEVLASREANQKFGGLYDEAFSGRESERYETTFVPAWGQSISKEGAIMVALNSGNEGNRQRLHSGGMGNTGPLTEEAIRGITDTLNEKDWAFVRGVAEFSNSYKGQVGALYKRVTGVEPEWVEPTPFQTNAGEMPGWYFPIKYSGRASAKAMAGPDASFADLIGQSSHMRFMTRNGHTEARAEKTSLPLQGNFGVIGEHVQQVIHDLTHREMLIDVGRILGHKDIQDAIYQNYGDQHYKELRSVFRDVAIGPEPPPDWYRSLQGLRRNYTMARLAWNFGTIIRHITNITSGMVRVGPADVTKAVVQWMGTAKDAEYSRGWIEKNSDLMSTRWKNRFDETQEIGNDIRANRGAWSAWMRDEAVKLGVDPNITHRMADTYLQGIHTVIGMAEVPTWIAAYRQSIEAAEPGDTDSHSRAVQSANAAITDAFGNGSIVDLPSVQRNYVGKLFSTFMQYGLSMYRQNFELYHKDAPLTQRAVQATLLNIMPLVILSGIFHYAYGRKKDTYLDEFANEAFDHAVGMTIFTRELQGSFRDAEYQGPAAFGEFGITKRAINQTYRAIEGESGKKAEAAFETGIELSGDISGMPIPQIEKSMEGTYQLWEGKTKNPSAILFGPPPKK